MADIGTGHGLLPLVLIRRGIAPLVIATEPKPGPLADAARRLQEMDGEQIVLRKGWGLAPLNPGEAPVLVLAGMGGETIRAILDSGQAVARSARKLVLQPQNRAERVRAWLLTHEFALVEEDLVEERSRFYPVLGAAPAPAGAAREETAGGPGTTKSAGSVVRPVSRSSDLGPELARFSRLHGLPPLPVPFLLTVGPLLLAGRHPVLAAQLRRQREWACALAERLQRLEAPRAARRLPAVREEIRLLEMVVEWLSPSVRS